MLEFGNMDVKSCAAVLQYYLLEVLGNKVDKRKHQDLSKKRLLLELSNTDVQSSAMCLAMMCLVESPWKGI